MFVVRDVPAGAAATVEPLGTKYKFWFRDPDFGLMLFKEGRPGTGENWAERIACELADRIGMPHARYELATYETREGVVSTSLVERGARIVHGNELLASLTTDYTQGARYRNSNHTLRRVVAYLRAGSDSIGAPYGWEQTERIRSALDFFVGYLMFDAWIGNQDRHDENWGLLRTLEGNLYLSPSFDHGSSMARNISDEQRVERLTTKNMQRHISKFVETARSGLYTNPNENAGKSLLTLDAFEGAAAFSRDAATEWKERLLGVDRTTISDVISMVPSEWMSAQARDFTAELLCLNRERILRL